MNAMERMTWRVGACLALVNLAVALGGCTAESLRVALDAQRRADAVQQAVFERQHEGLRILLFRDVVRRMGESGAALSAEQVEELNAAWNERDLLEFWALQHERAKALRVAGVDAKLFADQSMVDLLIRQVETRIDRLVDAAAEAAGEQVYSGEGVVGEP